MDSDASCAEALACPFGMRFAGLLITTLVVGDPLDRFLVDLGAG